MGRCQQKEHASWSSEGGSSRYRIKVSRATKAPDYAFRIGGARKFFVEAKKPSVNLEGNISPTFQLRRYAWSAKLLGCTPLDLWLFPHRGGEADLRGVVSS